MTNWLVASFFSKAKAEVAMDDGRKNQQLSAVLDEEEDDVAAPANTNVDRGAALEGAPTIPPAVQHKALTRPRRDQQTLLTPCTPQMNT